VRRYPPRPEYDARNFDQAVSGLAGSVTTLAEVVPAATRRESLRQSLAGPGGRVRDPLPPLSLTVINPTQAKKAETDRSDDGGRFSMDPVDAASAWPRPG